MVTCFFDEVDEALEFLEYAAPQGHELFRFYESDGEERVFTSDPRVQREFFAKFCDKASTLEAFFMDGEVRTPAENRERLAEYQEQRWKSANEGYHRALIYAFKNITSMN